MSLCYLDSNYCYYKEPIGFGSFSIIYKGYSHKDKKSVAIKQITKIIDKKYFDNEIELMKKLNNSNILKFYSAIKKDGKIFIVLEYCNGGDLSKYISTENTANDTKYLKEILNGLHFLYKNNILHRDIKPQNILIHNNQIKISDFGFAKSFEKNELITTFCGSPLYMAPEIIKDKIYSTQSDIWSLGVVLFELVSKRHPYYCDSRTELWDMAKSNNFKINYDIIYNSKIKKLIKGLLNFEPEKRLNWDNLFSDSLDNVGITKAISIKSNYSKKPRSVSLLIPTNNAFNSITQSINFKNKDPTYIKYDDCKIFSRSAPNALKESYLENYMNNKKSPEKKSIPIIGNSPELKSMGFYGVMNKSVNTIKGFFL